MSITTLIQCPCTVFDAVFGIYKKIIITYYYYHHHHQHYICSVMWLKYIRKYLNTWSFFSPTYIFLPLTYSPTELNYVSNSLTNSSSFGVIAAISKANLKGGIREDYILKYTGKIPLFCDSKLLFFFSFNF